MKFLTRLAQSLDKSFRDNPLNNPAVPLGGPGFWSWLFAGDVTESGEQINDLTALQHITVYTCVRIISSSIACLPLRLYRRLPRGREEAVDQRLWELLRLQPNPRMTAFTMWEAVVGSMALTGNGYAQIVRDGNGRVSGIYPLHPHKTEPFRKPDGKSIAYRTGDGMTLGETRVIEPEDILHIPLFSFDGLRGLDPILQSKQTVGLAKATEKFGARFFGNGSHPGGILTPKTQMNVDPKQMSQIKETMIAATAGVNQGKTVVLPGEWQWQQIGIAPEASQFLATQEFTRANIAAMFGIDPHRVGDLTRQASAGIEYESLQLVTDTLMPYMTRIEQEVERKLMPTMGRSAGQYFAEFDVSKRLRGDFETTMKGYSLGRQWGWLTPDMILEAEGKNPIGGAYGSSYLIPVNMVPVDANGEPISIWPSTETIANDAGGITKTTVLQQPKGPGIKPPKKEQDSLKRFMPAFVRLMRDATGRLARRSKRDEKDIRDIMFPVISSIGSIIAGRYAEQLVEQCFQDLLQRCSGWDGSDIDAVAERELRWTVAWFSNVNDGDAD